MTGQRTSLTLLAVLCLSAFLFTACGGRGQSTAAPLELGDAEPAGEANPDDVTCLIGSWSVDHASFAAFAEARLREQTGSRAALDLDDSTGMLLLGFSADGYSDLNGEDFSLTVSLANQGTFSLFVDAQDSAVYTVGADSMAVWSAGDASPVTSLDLPPGGGAAEFIVTPLDIFAYTGMGADAGGFSGAPDSAIASPFDCRGDTLILGTQGQQPLRWERFE